jgi:hypothetical protein
MYTAAGTPAKGYTVPGSAGNCLLWPTGRGNYLRSGSFRKAP